MERRSEVDEGGSSHVGNDAEAGGSVRASADWVRPTLPHPHYRSPFMPTKHAIRRPRRKLYYVPACNP